MSHSAFVQLSKTDAIIPNEDVTSEVDLSQQIPRLWTAHRESKLEAKRSKAELAHVHRELSAHLHEMKALLARTGRGGLWASFLRKHKIPRATADRYASAHEASLKNASENRLSEAIPEPMEVAVNRLVQRIHPLLWKTLTSKESAYLFVAEVIDKLPYVDYRITPSSVEVFWPGKRPAA